MTLKEFNYLSSSELVAPLSLCCGSSQWVKEVISNRPYRSIDLLQEKATGIWNALKPADWMEAFAQHPQIGNLTKSGDTRSNALKMASAEQSGTANADQAILDELAEINRVYFETFGYIFIICATGRSAKEMLDNLKQRLSNNPDKEILIATQEQNKITNIRLRKLII